MLYNYYIGLNTDLNMKDIKKITNKVITKQEID